jgi:hypothetical protein
MAIEIDASWHRERPVHAAVDSLREAAGVNMERAAADARDADALKRFESGPPP